MVRYDRMRAARRWVAGLGVPLAIGGLLLGAGGRVAPAAAEKAAPPAATFAMVRSQAAVAGDCLQGAQGVVKIVELGFAERMEVALSGLPKKTEFDLFVIQVPNAPFGLSWYQGDMTTDANGKAKKSFIGRFNEETFIVAPGKAPAPVVHPGDDAKTNPATGPVHTAHLGLWFNSPADAAKAGCGNDVTPFNGDHTAGIQALSTRQFGDKQGPLLQVKS